MEHFIRSSQFHASHQIPLLTLVHSVRRFTEAADGIARLAVRIKGASRAGAGHRG